MKVCNCTLTGGFLLEDPVAITVDAQGAVTLAFQATQAGVANPQTELVAIHRSADGTWGQSEGIATLIAGSVELTMAGSTPTLIWSDTGANGLDSGSYLAMAWAARQADGTWKSAAVNPDLNGSEMAHAPLADGSTLFTWTSGSGALQLNAARFLPDGTQDTSKVLLTSAAVSPHPAAVAADAAGNAIVVTADASGQAQFTGLDGSGPVVDSASVPTAGVTGVPGAFTVTAHDLWSPVTFAWDFGDGTSATGATVAHAFGAAGQYTATATLTDAAGHTTTTSGQVAVTDPPSPASTSTSAKTVTPPASGPNRAEVYGEARDPRHGVDVRPVRGGQARGHDHAPREGRARRPPLRRASAPRDEGAPMHPRDRRLHPARDDHRSVRQADTAGEGATDRGHLHDHADRPRRGGRRVEHAPDLSSSGPPPNPIQDGARASNPPAFAAPEPAALSGLSEVAWAHGLSVSVRSHDADLVRDGGPDPGAGRLIAHCHSSDVLHGPRNVGWLPARRVGRGAGRRLLESGDRLLGGFEERAQGGGEVALAVGGKGIARSLQGGVESLANLPERIGWCLRVGCRCGGSAGQHSVEI